MKHTAEQFTLPTFVGMVSPTPRGLTLPKARKVSKAVVPVSRKFRMPLSESQTAWAVKQIAALS